MWSQREVIDYALQRRSTLEALKRPGRSLARHDACDADPLLIRAALTPGGQVQNPGLFDHLYTYAWFVTFILSFVVYLAIMKRKA